MLERAGDPGADVEQLPLRLELASELAGLLLEPSVAAGVDEGLGRVAGEDHHGLQVVGRELVHAQLRQGDDAHRSALVDHRHDEHRLLDLLGALDRVAPLVVQRVVAEDGLRVGGHPAGERARTDVDPQQIAEVAVPQQPVGEGDRLAGPVLPVDGVDPDVVERGQGARLGHDGVGDGLDIGQPVQAGGQIVDGPHPRGLLGGVAVQARVADGHRGLVGEGLGQGQLIVGPFPVARVVEADDADRAVVAHQRHEACRLDPLVAVDGLERADARVGVRVAGHERPPLSDGLRPERGAVERELADHRLEGGADPTLGGQVERMLPLVVDHPQAHPVGVEQAARPIGDVTQNRAELQLPGQLPGDAGQGPGPRQLATGAGDGPGMAERHAGRGGGRGHEPPSAANPRAVDVIGGQQHADALLADGQRQPDAAIGGDVVSVRGP